jgi:hypothetical protein
MNRRPKALNDTLVGRPTDNQSRVECAMVVLQEMAIEAARRRHSGTIGVEIPIKDGKLGKVKQLQIVFHPE